MKTLFAILLFIAFNALADCPQFYHSGTPVHIPHGIELCNSFYVVEFDTELNAPILSAEAFRPQTVHVERSNDFHPDLRLRVSTRAERADYAHSGYDQGHLTPAADATTDEEMHDTFLLSNMTPQIPTLNRQSWRLLEIKVRQLAPDYVLTGAVYSSDHASIGAHAVPVPVGYYKIIWMHGIATAWYADNLDHAQTHEIAIGDLEKLTGLAF